MSIVTAKPLQLPHLADARSRDCDIKQKNRLRSAEFLSRKRREIDALQVIRYNKNGEKEKCLAQLRNYQMSQQLALLLVNLRVLLLFRLFCVFCLPSLVRSRVFGLREEIPLSPSCVSHILRC